MGDGREAPSGTVAFVLTDIEGSTRHARALGDDYAALIGRHHELLRSAWHAHDGFEVFTEGDAFIVAFAHADDAVLAAVEAQRLISAEPWGGGREVRIRIGLHAGYARPVDGDYRAFALNQASRVQGSAHGGQTYATDEIVSLVTDRIPHVSFEPLGSYRVRDFDGPIRLYSVRAEGMPVVQAAPRVRPADGHNVVPPTAPLVGREPDVQALLSMLVARSLTTIAGPGGVGKTRLALEVTMLAAPNWPDGAWLVDLTPVVEAEDVPSAVAQAVGTTVASGQDVWPEVLTHLEQRRCLIVLDNCEHLVDGIGPLVKGVLAHCPGCAVLTTSRTPLGLLEEKVRRLGALAVNNIDAAGVQLFVDRVADPTMLERSDVLALCRELEGLPLAIELAAARTSVMPPADILRRLRAAPTVLHSRDPSLPERQRSLVRSLDWSFDLLGDDAKAVYGRLSVFAAGFDLDAAEHVCAGGAVLPDDVAELVWSLVDASLVLPDIAAGTTRYRLPMVVRSHATAKADDEEALTALRRLAEYEISLVGPDLPGDSSWRGAMDLELDNVRAVVAALATGGNVQQQAVAQTLAWSIGRYHESNNSYRTGVEELSRWSRALPYPGPERAVLLGSLALHHLNMGEVDAAARVLAEADDIAADCELPQWDNVALERIRGEIAIRRSDLSGAISIARSALERATTPRAEARLLNLLGIAFAELGDIAAATEATEREIECATKAGMETYLVGSHGNLAELRLRAGDAPGAAASQLVCLELSRAYGGVLQRGFCVVVAAHLAAGEGNWPLGVELQRAADMEFSRLEWVPYAADADQRRRLLDGALDALGDDAFSAASDAGSALSIDAA
ncbi:MAG TPA: adenylate/guanylate cyclase domain-containing protein, partial [Ilumatobacteraceae bacterium]|nr:adenylate/guanylate cyclase domain-containing protein [Ilumatobacteraceae bacterium]